MRFLQLSIITIACFGFTTKPVINNAASPLSQYSAEWDKPQYLACNTAASVDYMNEEEKKVVYILNMARMNPQLFCRTVVKKFPVLAGKNSMVNSEYYRSLVKKLNSMKKLELLQPDQKLYTSAQCHAYTSGVKGYVGHDRQDDSCGSKRYFNGECCDYGHNKAIDILMALLVDEGVPSLGHRDICFSSYKTLAVSIQPHSQWSYNAVLDFHY